MWMREYVVRFTTFADAVPAAHQGRKRWLQRVQGQSGMSISESAARARKVPRGRGIWVHSERRLEVRLLRLLRAWKASQRMAATEAARMAVAKDSAAPRRPSQAPSMSMSLASPRPMPSLRRMSQ